MASRHSAAIAAIVNDLNQQLTTNLGLGAAFQDEPNCPGQKFGVIDPQSWRNGPNPFESVSEMPCNIWITAAYASYSEARIGAIKLMADLDSVLLNMANISIDRRKILMEMIVPQDLARGLRAPIVMPNTGTKHLWIADITGSLTLRFAIGKNVCGHV
jgi:hypothetical protein